MAAPASAGNRFDMYVTWRWEEGERERGGGGGGGEERRRGGRGAGKKRTQRLNPHPLPERLLSLYLTWWPSFSASPRAAVVRGLMLSPTSDTLCSICSCGITRRGSNRDIL